MGHPAGVIEDFALGAPEPIPEVEPAMAIAFRNALSLLRKAGASIRAIDISGMLTRPSDAVDTATFYEGAQFHQQRFKDYGDRLGAELVDLVQKGFRSPRSGTMKPCGTSIHARLDLQSCSRPSA